MMALKHIELEPNEPIPSRIILTENGKEIKYIYTYYTTER